MDATTSPKRQILYGSPAGKQKKKKAKDGIQRTTEVKYPASVDRKTQVAVETPVKKTAKKNTDEPYKDFLSFPKTGKVLPCKKNLIISPCALE